MAAKKRTAKEEAWIAAYASTGDPVYAALQAGYAPVAIRAAAARNVSDPTMIAEAAREVRGRLHTDLAPMAVDRLKEFLEPESKYAPKLVLEAAKIVLSKTVGDATAPEGGKALAEMTAGEMEAAIASLRSQLNERAESAIDITPREVEPLEDVEVIDIFD